MVSKAVADYCEKSNKGQLSDHDIEVRRRKADFTPHHQYELFEESELTMLQRVLAFVRDLRN